MFKWLKASKFIGALKMCPRRLVQGILSNIIWPKEHSSKEIGPKTFDPKVIWPKKIDPIHVLGHITLGQFTLGLFFWVKIVWVKLQLDINFLGQILIV